MIVCVLGRVWGACVGHSYIYAVREGVGCCFCYCRLRACCEGHSPGNRLAVMGPPHRRIRHRSVAEMPISSVAVLKKRDGGGGPFDLLHPSGRWVGLSAVRVTARASRTIAITSRLPLRALISEVSRDHVRRLAVRLSVPDAVVICPLIDSFLPGALERRF